MFMGSYTDLKKRRRKQQKAYNPNNLLLAVQAVQDGSMNAYQAAQIYGVPRRTISYRVQKARERFLMSLNITQNNSERELYKSIPPKPVENEQEYVIINDLENSPGDPENAKEPENI